MKHRWLFAGVFFFVFCLIFPLFSQTVIENPEKPISENAGRTVRLEEAQKIEEAGDAFYFQMPYNLKIGPGGSIFVQDSGQLLLFDRDGRFVRNFFKKGQGPGEVSSIRDYAFEGDDLIVHCPSPNKIVRLDAAGELIKEFRIEEPVSGLHFSLCRRGSYFFYQFEFPRDRGEPEIRDVPHNLYEFSADEGELKKLEDFPVPYYVVWAKGGGGAVIPMKRLISVPAGEKYLVISHRPEYQVKVYDLDKREVIRVFGRRYTRVKTPSDFEGTRGPIIDGEVVVPPRPKFLNDIQNIFVHQDRIWVLTSSADEDKGTLFDVFDFEGRYVDNFYLQIPSNTAPAAYGFEPVTVYGDFICFIESTEDETFVIKKYRLLGL